MESWSNGESQLGEGKRAPDRECKANCVSRDLPLGPPWNLLRVKAPKRPLAMGPLLQITWACRFQHNRKPTLEERDKDQTQRIAKGEPS